MAFQTTGIEISRRGVLGGLAAGTALATAGCCPCRASTYDVAIVGAGSAGIAAAQALRAFGRTAIVLEAGARIGGRAWTDTRTFHTPFDIGCAWIHAGHNNPYVGFALKDGFHLRKHDVDTLNKLFYGGAYDPDIESLHKAEFLIEAAGIAKAKAREDEPLAGVLANCAKPMDAAATFIGPMDAAVDLKDESTEDYAAENGANYDPNYLVQEGFGALVAKVGEGIGIHKSTPVRAIRYGDTSVKVDTARGTIEARAAIVTVSMGVLQKGGIKFTPALPPATQDAIGNLPMGLLTKIPLLVSGIDHGIRGIEPYDNVLNEMPQTIPGPGCGEERGNFYFLAWPWNTDLMVGFVGGSYAWELSRYDDRHTVAMAVESLSGIFGTDVGKKVKASLVTPWANLPTTHGAYAAARPGHADAREVLRKPIKEQVFFAGEAVAEGGLFATCGGAYQSGTAVALEVHNSLGPA